MITVRITPEGRIVGLTSASEDLFKQASEVELISARGAGGPNYANVTVEFPIVEVVVAEMEPTVGPSSQFHIDEDLSS